MWVICVFISTLTLYDANLLAMPPYSLATSLLIAWGTKQFVLREEIVWKFHSEHRKHLAKCFLSAMRNIFCRSQSINLHVVIYNGLMHSCVYIFFSGLVSLHQSIKIKSFIPQRKSTMPLYNSANSWLL